MKKLLATIALAAIGTVTMAATSGAKNGVESVVKGGVKNAATIAVTVETPQRPDISSHAPAGNPWWKPFGICHCFKVIGGSGSWAAPPFGFLLYPHRLIRPRRGVE